MKKIKNNKKNIYNLLYFGVLAFALIITNVYADENDPIAVVNNLSDFIFQITKVIGGIIVGYSVVQIGLSFTSHDGSQRVNGFLFFLGGVIIMYAKKILEIIAG